MTINFAPTDSENKKTFDNVVMNIVVQSNDGDYDVTLDSESENIQSSSLIMMLVMYSFFAHMLESNQISDLEEYVLWFLSTCMDIMLSGDDDDNDDEMPIGRMYS